MYLRQLTLLLACCLMTAYAALAQADGVDSIAPYQPFCKRPAITADMPSASLMNTRKSGLILISGNVLYDGSYRSYLDTPFVVNDLTQHSIQTRLQFKYRDLPVEVIARARFSNTDYFRNYFDASVRFGASQFQDFTKSHLKELVEKQYQGQLSQITAMRTQLTSMEKEAHEMSEFVGDPVAQQNLVAAKEFLHTASGGTVKKINSKTPVGFSSRGFKPSLKPQIPRKFPVKNFETPEEAQRYINAYDSAQKLIDSVQRLSKKMKADLKQKEDSLKRKVDSVKSLVDQAKNGVMLEKLMEEQGISRDSLGKKARFLMNLRTISVGRSNVNYSELTAKNISVTGVGVEYAGRTYWAFHAGTVDYRFRDFTLNRFSGPRQYLALARLGKGSPEGSHIIGTVYRGRKVNNYYSANNGTSDVYGFSLEGKFAINANHSITAEMAKSSVPVQAGSAHQQLHLNDAGSNAYALSLSSRIPSTQTRITGTYRWVGEDFQSFSLFNSFSRQQSFNAMLDQTFWQRMFNLKLGVRKNEFLNPYVAQGLKANAVYKTAYLSFRRNRLPFLAVSYMPSSQLTKIGGSYIENQFQALTAMASYAYRHRATLFNTTITYSRFFNEATDSFFVYYNSMNYSLINNITRGRFAINSSYSLLKSTSYDWWTLDQGLTYKSYKGLQLGAGIKINRLNQEELRPALYANLGFSWGKMGQFLFGFDRSYIPNTSKNLLKTDMGRVTYSKYF